MGELALASLRLHLDNWKAVGQLSGHEFAGRIVSRLQVALDEQEEVALDSAEALYNSTSGFSARRLTRAQLRRAEPRLTTEAVGGLWTEGNARVEPGSYTRAVAAAAVALGARRIRGDVQGVEHAGREACAVLLGSTSLRCDGVVIASGPWCAEPSRWLSMPLPVRPIKGELLLVNCGEPSPRAEVTWRGLGVYEGAQRRLWLGGTEEDVGFDAKPSSAARDRILADVRRLMPGLQLAEIVNHVAGLRPMTADGLPIVGIPAGWDNVCLATGAGRKGMLLGAGLGYAASELLMAGSTRMPIGACTPERQAVAT